MTVSDNTSRNQYTATSGQTVFAYTFEIVDKDHIVVLQNGTVLSEGTDYTVSNVGNDNGGNVTLTTGATADDIITLYRDMPYSRTQNYTNSGDFLASEVNADFDELWLAGEQTDRSFSQSIRKPITDSDTISMELPDAATRASKYLRFTDTGAVTVATATTTVAADSVLIDDAGNYYDSDNVEGALQEIGADLETKAPIDSPTFTGTVTIPSPFTLDSTSVTVSGTELNYLDGLTGNVQQQIDSIDVESIAHINEYINPPDGSGPVSDSVALTNACNAAEVILFGGTTMDIDADWTFPVGGIARRWMFQGNTWNLTNNAQIVLDNVTDFAIVGDGATVDGNWKVARVNGATASQPTTITVDSGHNFAVDDIVSSSWSLNYLPNSVSRAAAPLGGDFNRVASTTATTITLDHQVVSTTTVPTADNKLAGGTYLINAVFSKSGIEFEGTGHFHVEGVTFQNMPNAYAINVNDSTEAAKASIVNCEINGIALDAINFRGDTLYMRDFKVRDVRDISKQVLVWSNQTKKGRLYGESCDWAHNNQDAFFYTNVSETDALAYAPDMVWINCVFDGFNNNDFSPRQAKQGSSLNWQSRGGASHIIAGKVEFINCNFFNIQRHILGTTNTAIEVFTQDKITFQNCNMDCEGVFYKGTGISRLTVAPIIYDNCNMRASNYRLHIGVGEVHYRNSVIQEKGATNIAYFVRGDEQEETSTTTTRVYHQGEYVINTGSGLVYEATPGSSNSFVTTSGDALTGSKFTEVARIYYVEAGSTTTSAYVRGDFVKNAATNKIYECVTGGADQYEAPSGTSLGNTTHFEINEIDVPSGHFENTRIIGNFDFVSSSDTVFDNLLLPYRSGLVVPHFERIYQENLDNKIVLEGATPTDATAIDLEDWFTNGTNITDVPNMSIKIAGTDAIAEFGADESSLRELHFKLKARRFDSTVGATSPLPMKGAFLVDPLENSLVFATRRPGDVKRITETHSADVNASASAGASSVVITNVASSAVPVVGDWVSLNNDGDSDVYFHEITAVSGTSPYTLTITPTLTEAITTSTNSYLIKHEYIYVHVDDNGDVDIDGDLDVSGTVTANGATVAGNILLQNEGDELQFNTSSAPVNKIYSDDTYTSNGLTISADNGVALKSTNNYLLLDDTGTNEMVLNVDGGERMRVTSTGIDVTGKLETSGNNNGGAKANYIRITDTDTSATLNNQQGGIEFYTSDSGNEGVTASIENLYAGSGAGSNLTINTAASGGAGATEKFRVDANGAVGVGTSSPGTYGGFTVQQASNSSSKGIAIVDSTAAQSIKLWANATYAYISSGNTGADPLILNTGGGSVRVGDVPATVDGNFAVRSNSDSHAITMYEPTGGNESWSLGINGAGDLGFYNSGSTSASVVFDDTGNVGIGTQSPNVHGWTKAVSLDASTSAGYELNKSGVKTGAFAMQGDGRVQIINFTANPLTFNTNGAERMRLDSSGRVGIGVAAPSTNLHVYDATSNVVGTFESGDSNVYITLADSATTSDTAMRIGVTGNDLHFSTSATERMRISSAGNVGIGTASPSYLVDAQSSGDAAIRIRSTGTSASDDSLLRMQIAGTTGANIIAFGDSGSSFSGEIRYQHSNNSLSFDTNGTEAMRIDSSGNLLVSKTTSAIATEGVTLGGGQHYFTTDGDAAVKLNRLSSDGEIVQLRKDGTQVGSIGTSNGDLTIYSSASGHGGVRFAASGILPLDNTGALSDATEDIGQTDQRWKDLYLSGAITSGSIDAAGESFFGGSLDIRLNSSASNSIFEGNSSSMAVRNNGSNNINYELGGANVRYTMNLSRFNATDDNARELGSSSARWSTVYAATGTINTSDERLKQQVRDISEAEARVAVAAKGLLKAYKYNDAVEAKGDGARWHIGIMAQELKAAFEAEGLDAHEYGMFCWNEWWEADVWHEDESLENGGYYQRETFDSEADAPADAVRHDRYSIRYEELLAFIIASI